MSTLENNSLTNSTQGVKSRPPLMPRIFNCDTCNVKYRNGTLRDFLVHKLEEGEIITVETIEEYDKLDNIKYDEEEDNIDDFVTNKTIDEMFKEDSDEDDEMMSAYSKNTTRNQSNGFIPIKLSNNRRIPKAKPKPAPVAKISFDIFAELKKFKELLINGVITEEQYDKANILLFDKYRNDVLSL
jgi:hypothetical protein